jgi:protein-disulfide isomerase
VNLGAASTSISITSVITAKGESTMQDTLTRFQRLKSVLELTATVFMILASAAVMALVVQKWRTPDEAPREPQRINRQQSIPQSPQSLEGARVVGDRAAKIVLIQYSDFECPYCAMFSRDIWPQIKTQYVDSGKVMMAFRHRPAPTHRFARDASISAECAGQQGKFWEMHDRLFEAQERLQLGIGSSFAPSLGLDQAKFENCAQKGSREFLIRDASAAEAAGINATPTFVIGSVNDDGTVKPAEIVVGAQPFSKFKPILDRLLEETSSRRSVVSRLWR